MQLQYLLEHSPPGGRRQKREQTFNDQHQGQRQPECVAVQVYFFAGAGGSALPRMALKNSDDEGSTTIRSPFLLKLAL